MICFRHKGRLQRLITSHNTLRASYGVHDITVSVKFGHFSQPKKITFYHFSHHDEYFHRFKSEIEGDIGVANSSRIGESS